MCVDDIIFQQLKKAEEVETTPIIREERIPAEEAGKVLLHTGQRLIYPEGQRSCVDC